jgi:two-component system response regulator HydG
LLPWDDVEEKYILKVLKVVNNNKTQTASLIGYDRRTLYRKLKEMARKGIYDGMGAPPTAPATKAPPDEA